MEQPMLNELKGVNRGSMRVVVLISGRGSNLVALQESAKVPSSRFEITAVVSDKQDAAGLAFATNEGIATEVIPRLPKERSNADFNLALAEAVKRHKPDLVVLAGFMRIISTEFISQFPKRIINIHPSLLPAFRGLNAQAQALAAGVKFAGCSVHYVSEEVDGGPIIAQAVVPVFTDDTEESLSSRILSKEHLLYPAVVRLIARGQISLKDSAGKEGVQIAKEAEAALEQDFMISVVS